MMAIAASTPIFGPTNTTIPATVVCADGVRGLAVMMDTIASVTTQPSANTPMPARRRPFGGRAAASCVVMTESRVGDVSRATAVVRSSHPRRRENDRHTDQQRQRADHQQRQVEHLRLELA